MKPEEAETLALKALSFLAQSPDELGRFVAVSGIFPDDLRLRAGDPEILAAVMDFILAEDSRVTGFCETLAADPRLLYLARRALPGG
ncbi:MAG: DUF3572 domain-containing protein [Rhizomicrobium sp.]